jgi:hypothetical protein
VILGVSNTLALQPLTTGIPEADFCPNFLQTFQRLVRLPDGNLRPTAHEGPKALSY